MTTTPDQTTGRTGPIAWRRTGASPRIVLLHGFSDDSGCWDPWLERFGAAGPDGTPTAVLTIDARGHGSSDLPDGPVSATIQAADVATVLDELGGGPFVVVGHSMGAATAAALTRDRPDLVAAAVLEDPRGTAVDAAPSREVADWLLAVRADDETTAAQRCRTLDPGWPEAEVAPWVASKRRLDLAVFDRPRPAAPALADVLGDVTRPVLIVHGEADRGGLLDADTAEDCVRAGAGAVTRVSVAGAGHNVRRDDPAAYLAAVLPWVGDALRG